METGSFMMSPWDMDRKRDTWAVSHKALRSPGHYPSLVHVGLAALLPQMVFVPDPTP
jgi:hypothetical protein